MGAVCQNGFNCRTEVAGYSVEIKKITAGICTCQNCKVSEAEVIAITRSKNKKITQHSCLECVKTLII